MKTTLIHLFAGLIALSCTLAHAVGFQRITVPGPNGVPMHAAVWYPSRDPASPMTLGPVTQTVAENGAIDGRSLPLIVISHGSGGSSLGHHDTAMALAEAGYIVVAVTHPGDNFADQSRTLFIMERPQHISRLIDFMMSDWRGHAAIDSARIGMFGFSAGGFTTLVSIGGIADFSKVAPFCRERPMDFTCQVVARQGGISDTPTDFADERDLRIKAAVIAAPALGFSFAPHGLDRVSVPIALWRAEDDTVLPHPWSAEAVRLALPRAAQYEVVPHAGHYDFLAPCSPALAESAPEICVSAKGFDRTAFHRAFNASIVSFFDQTLNAHNTATAVILPIR